MATQSNTIFFIEVDKIKPNPYQPRREFEEDKLKDLANSIRQYGLLQPLTVSRVEIVKEDGGIIAEYELIAGERRLRASKLAGMREIPVIIRTGDDNMMKLELAIIENLHREDLNVVDRARAFFKLADEFKFTHGEIGKKMGKSREYVSNTLRILVLPEEILNALSSGKISEGHTRPLLMLSDRPEEQNTLFKEIIVKRISVREAERISRKIAFDKVRNKEYIVDPEIVEMEELLQESLGTRVHIERKDYGGKLMIDFFSNDDLRTILDLLKSNENKTSHDALDRKLQEMNTNSGNKEVQINTPIENIVDTPNTNLEIIVDESHDDFIPEVAEDDRTKEEIRNDEEDTDLYNIKDFSL